MRAKDYLRARGVEFDAIDVSSDAEALDDLQRRGLYAIPVVAIGDAYVLARELDAIDRLLGWAPQPREPLPARGLAQRMIRLLRASVRYARQLPPDHYDDVIPGQEGVTGPLVLPSGAVLRLADGTPYMPHHTYFGLVAHIAGHASKFTHLAARPESDVFARMETFAPLGEPPASASLEDVCLQIEGAAAGIAAWSGRVTDSDLVAEVMSDQGPVTLHRMLDAMTYSTAQHTRQLMAILGILGIEPDGPLSDSDYEGLALPVATWG